MIIDSFPDRQISVDGKKYLYFGGTSYLGMSSLKDFQNILAQNIYKWGTNYGSSRNSNIKLSIHSDFEKVFSEFIGAETTVSVSSGMLAGKLLMKYLSKSKRNFFHYPNTHPAIIGPASKPLFVAGKLNNLLNNDRKEDIVISVDAVLSLEVEATKFDFLELLPSNKNIILILDESHSLGLIGENGRGIFKDISSKRSLQKIMVSSLGKAMGLSFGVICGDLNLIEPLRNEADFISASGTNPAFLATFLQSNDLYNRQRKKLINNLDFISKIIHSGYGFNQDYPVIYSNDSSLYSSLFKEYIIISKFKYPTYHGTMVRIVFTANHVKKDLKKLIQLLNINYGS